MRKASVSKLAHPWPKPVVATRGLLLASPRYGETLSLAAGCFKLEASRILANPMDVPGFVDGRCTSAVGLRVQREDDERSGSAQACPTSPSRSRFGEAREGAILTPPLQCSFFNLPAPHLPPRFGSDSGLAVRERSGSRSPGYASDGRGTENPAPDGTKNRGAPGIRG